MALVTLDDVETLTQRSFSSEEEATVQLLIDTLESELETYCNRPLTVKAFTGEKVTVRADGTLFLKNSPVVSVTQVQYDTDPPTAFTSTYEIKNGLVTFGPSTRTTDLIVDYTAGVAEPRNAAAKSILLARLSRIVAKVHDDALGVSNLSQEGYTAAYLAEGWTDQELKIMDRWRRRVVRTGV